MALTQLNLNIEVREISLKDRPNELLNISPKGTVPVLFIDENNIIDESIDIMLWAVNQTNSKWLDIEKEKQLKIILNIDVNFKQWLDKYKYHDRYQENSYEFYQNKCSQYLKKYNDKLKDNKYILGNEFQLVDIAIFPFIRQCANVNLNWFQSNFIHLNKWLHEFINSVLFTSVMNKYEIWDKKSTNYIINFKI